MNMIKAIKRNIITMCALGLSLMILPLYADQMFFENPPIVDEKPIVVIIPSHNNSKWCISNLISALEQRYESFRIIYIDDCSSDDTYEMVNKCIRERDAYDRVKVVHNSYRRGALANIYTAIHTCNDNEIIVLLDGDDWFAHSGVLAKVNSAYQDTNIWVTYGQFKAFPDNRIGECCEISQNVKNNSYYREWKWVALHLRTFYAGLFKKIKLEDFLYEGTFFDVTGDMALMFPLLEMSGGRFKFISEVLYSYNCATQNNDHKVKLERQLHCEKVVRSRKKYSALKELIFEKSTTNADAAIIIFAHHPVKLLATLTTVDHYVTNKAEIYVIHQADEYNDMYKELKNQFNVRWLSYQKNEFRDATLHAFNDASTPYVLCLDDNCMVKDFINIQEVTAHLEKTHAHVFSLMLGKNITENKKIARKQKMPPLTQVGEDIFAWQFMHGEHDWRITHSLHGCVYRKYELTSYIHDINFKTFSEFEIALNKMALNLNCVGLCFAQSKALIMHYPDCTEIVMKAPSDQGLKIDEKIPFKIANDAIVINMADYAVNK